MAQEGVQPPLPTGAASFCQCRGASFAYSGGDQDLYDFPDLREEFPFAEVKKRGDVSFSRPVTQ